MKTKVVTIFAVLIISASLSAKDKKSKQQVTYEVSMTCEKCKKKIERNIAFEKGVTDMFVNLPEKTVTIEFQENKTDTANLRKAFEKMGYKATALKDITIE